jgi:hypothetical protein
LLSAKVGTGYTLRRKCMEIVKFFVALLVIIAVFVANFLVSKYTGKKERTQDWD